jgi:hypothetical protein
MPKASGRGTKSGSTVVAFRASPETEEALDEFCAARGITRSAAVRLIVDTTLAAASGADPRQAAILAAIEEAVWQVFSDGREILAETLADTADTLHERLLERFNGRA